ncbi:MAG: hypothetical protein K0U98_28350 [Deltaproteobacteria bacterium]|nr:hypothetical protein [Deltaproteobacteria bacterium]
MATRHLTIELVRQWIEQKVDTREFFWVLLSHVVLDCPICDMAWREGSRGRVPGRGLFAELQHKYSQEGMSGEDAIAKTIALVLSMKDDVLQSVSDELMEKRLQELLRLPMDEAIEAVGKSRTKFVHPRLAEKLLLRCEVAYGTTSEEMADSAERAELVALRARELKKEWQPFATDLHALAMTLQANALRLQGKYAEANDRLDFARRILDEGSGDPIVFADLSFYRASLLLDQYKHEDAIREAKLAVRVYGKCGEEHKAGKALMKLSLIHSEAGNAQQAVEVLQTATQNLDFSKEPRLEILVHENLALYLAEAGDPAKALEVLGQHPLDPRRNRRSLLKRDWIEARIQTALGETVEAGATLANIREEFAEVGDAVSTALVSLDLALIFVEKGMAQQVKQLAEETLPLLQPMAIPQEIWAALFLFKQAADAEEVTDAVIESVREVVEDRRKWRVEVLEN